MNQYGEEEVIGKCHRAVYYRLKGVKPTNPPTNSSQVVFLLGHQVEAAVTEAWKQMGIWENNSVRWENKGLNLSGEYDVVLREGDLFYGVEVKSFYGYHANKQILGHWSGRGKAKRFIAGKPKDEHLMQAVLYVKQSDDDLAGFKLFYVSRDNCDMAEHNITIDKEDNIYINGKRETRFTVKDIHERYKTMNMYIENDLKPDREYTLHPSDERVEVLFQRGALSKTAYESHTKGKEKVRDWHCSYCDHKDHCWNVDTGEEPIVTKAEEVAPDALVHGSL